MRGHARIASQASLWAWASVPGNYLNSVNVKLLTLRKLGHSRASAQALTTVPALQTGQPCWTLPSQTSAGVPHPSQSFPPMGFRAGGASAAVR